MAEIEINNNKFVIREKFTGKAAYIVSNAFQALMPILAHRVYLENPEAGYDQYVTICRYAIESWPYDSDPTDAKSYEQISTDDLFSLFYEVFSHTISFFTRSEKVPAER